MSRLPSAILRVAMLCRWAGNDGLVPSCSRAARLPRPRSRAEAFLAPRPALTVALASGLALTFGLGLAFSLALMPAPAHAQAASADWRTIETPHFRVHYTAPDEAWTLRVAPRLEAIRARVSAEVGYAPPDIVDVLVMDPIRDANGMALPMLRWPRMILFTSPPGPDSELEDYDDWFQLLITHEETHLAHMLRPSRRPLQRLIGRVLPFGPIAKRAPRWVDEGYATLVEGKLTGFGRPNGTARAAILRQRARAGKLPTYAQMSEDTQTYAGMSMAYLAGSAYLEWLEQRNGPGALDRLWARMTARNDRSFSAAFTGVFGDPPQTLYRRFTAELTWRAMEAERRLAPAAREGELWQDLKWHTEGPVLSPDGKTMAVILRDREKPSRLVVWSTAPDEKADKDWNERNETMLKRDPEDIAPVKTRPLPRHALHELVTRKGAEPMSPRFMPDGKSILFVRFEPAGRMLDNPFLRLCLHPDLFRWTPETGRVERVTHLADVREPDPAPEGAWAVAVRNRNGFSQLVRVDLSSGVVADMTQPSLETVVAEPRVSPDGSRIAFVRHEDGAWSLIVREIASGRESRLPAPVGALVADPAWSADGSSIFACVGQNGFMDVRRFRPDGSGSTPVTAMIGAALAPAPVPDGSGLFFLSLEADGLAIRRISLDAAAQEPPSATLAADLAPAVRPVPPAPQPPYGSAPVAKPRPYGIGRPEFLPLLGGDFSASSRSVEFGLRAGDLLGRMDVVAMGSVGTPAGPRGGSLAAVWRGRPMDFSLQAFDAIEEPSRQPRRVQGLGPDLDLAHRGAELSASWQRWWRITMLGLRGGGLLDRLEPATVGAGVERSAFLSGGLTRTPSLGSWHFSLALTANGAAGRFRDDAWKRVGGVLSAGAARKWLGLQLIWQRDRERDATLAFDRLQLGGAFCSVLPAEATGGRIPVPALPAGILIGDDYESQTARLDLGSLPLFFARHRMGTAGAAFGPWLRLAGIEWNVRFDPEPVFRMPGCRLILGAARVLDQPLKNTTVGWVAVSWRP